MDMLLIIGAGGHGRVVADIALKMQKWSTISFLDDEESKQSIIGVELVGTVSDIEKYKDKAEFIVALGDNDLRRKIQSNLEGNGFTLTNLVHPSAVISTGVVMGKGNVIMAGVIINALTELGKGCIINTASSLDHDNIIKDFVHISPGTHLAGSVIVGENTFIGTGSSVVNNVTICSNCTIGAGTVVIKDIGLPGTYVGVPAFKIK